MQLKYMDKGAMLFQMLLLAAIAALGAVFGPKSGDIREPADLYAWAAFSSVAFSTAASVACGIGDRYHIAELAGSCFFDHRQICVLRMTFSGAGGLISLGALILAVCRHAGNPPLWRTGVYLLVPYIVTGCFEFALLGVGGLGRSPYVLWAGGLVMAVVSGIVSSVRGVYEAAATGIWIMVLLSSAAAWALELAVLFRKIGKGDMLCTD